MSVVGRLIRERRIAKGMSQESLAEGLGTSQRQISRWEGYTTELPRELTRDRLGRVLGIAAPEWHLAAAKAAGSRATPAHEAEPTPARPDFLREPLPSLLARLGAEQARGLLFDMRASADPARRVPQSDRVRPRKPHYVIEVEGECMVPELHPGDLVHFDPDLQPEHGDWVVATLDGGSATVKRLVVTGGVMQQLLPLNGEPLVIDENVRIVGVVLSYERPGPRGRRR